MARGKYDPEIAEVEAFLAEAKSLEAPEPPWIKSSRRDELQATWGIVDSAGVSRAELRFRCPSLSRNDPSVSLVYRRLLVCRIDVLSPEVWKPNPPAAIVLGLPPIVTGTHGHRWTDNREHIRINGFGELPFRCQLSSAIRRLPQAIATLADEINLTLGSDQWGFDVPPRSSLFE
jgi:hypothetical protein